MTKLFNYNDGVEDYKLSDYIEQAYLDYSLYVIKDRGLPFIGDGLKPVQRRVIYTMSIEGIDNSNKKKKSAFIVGQVLGRFHPHGDQACYESMVTMSQDFNYRYPLILGQGNFGDIFEPKGYAAMRYTEAYLSPVAKYLTQELNQGGTKFTLNYTGDEKEPEYLPARVPQILLNGATGVVVGMATDIPPHNNEEVINAVIAMLDNPKLTVADLVPAIIKGPDYPCGGEIINSTAELVHLYTVGKATPGIKMRAKWRQESNRILIYDLPYQSASGLIKGIADAMQKYKLTMIDDIRDESTETETIIALILRGRNVNCELLMNSLYQHTNLNKTLKFNLNMIGLDRKPAVKNLTTIILEWISFRKQIVTLRYEHRLGNLRARLNRVRGYLIAFNNLDKVIEIVRFSVEAKQQLIQQFKLNDDQAESILELKMRNLAKLEEDKLISEENALLKEEATIIAILASDKLLVKQIKKELLEDLKTIKEPRRTQIIERQAIDKSKKIEVVTAPVEKVTVILSKAGYIRCAKGHDLDLTNLNFLTGDQYHLHREGQTDQSLLLLDDNGRSYSLDFADLPNGKTTGKPLSSIITIEDKTSVVDLMITTPETRYLLASDSGYGFICTAKNLEAKNKNGKAVVNLTPDSGLLTPIALDNPDLNQVIAITSSGRLLMFDLDSLPQLSKGKGNKIIDLNGDPGAKLQILSLATTESKLKFESGKRITRIDNSSLLKAKASRGRKGLQIVRGINILTKLTVE